MVQLTTHSILDLTSIINLNTNGVITSWKTLQLSLQFLMNSDLTSAFEAILEGALGAIVDNNECITTTTTTSSAPASTTTSTLTLIP